MNGRYERNPGRIVELSPGGSQDLLDIQWKDEIAHVICVTLVGPPALTAGNANAAVVVAHVQWGAGEAEAEADIDFGVGGIVFTLPASSIRITADYEATFASGESDPVVRVGAFACVGSGARQTRLTRTIIAPDPILAAAQASFDVPPFARGVRVLTGDEATRSYRLDFFTDVAAPNPVYAVEVAAGTAAPLVDLTPDITTVVMTNTGAASLTEGARAIFELGI
jgi:hypothetical protein